MKILAADIGGTHSRLEVYEADNDKLHSLARGRYRNADYEHLNAIVAQFYEEYSLHKSVVAAVFAIAGPVAEQAPLSLTNLDWQLEPAALQKQFALQRVLLLNDFSAIAYGIEHLPETALHGLQCGSTAVSAATKVRAFIGAGTGLGQAWSLSHGRSIQVLASEAGHSSFAPADTMQRQLLDYYSDDSKPVDTEFFLSGRGLVRIYQALAEFNGVREHLTLSLLDPQAAAQITAAANQGDELALECIQIFWQIYAAHAGNVALQYLPYAGLYLAGGIAPKLQPFMDQAGFLDYFRNKATMANVLETIPLAIILDDEVARLGAAHYLLQQY